VSVTQEKLFVKTSCFRRVSQLWRILSVLEVAWGAYASSIFGLGLKSPCLVLFSRKS